MTDSEKKTLDSFPEGMDYKELEEKGYIGQRAGDDETADEEESEYVTSWEEMLRI